MTNLIKKKMNFFYKKLKISYLNLLKQHLNIVNYSLNIKKKKNLSFFVKKKIKWLVVLLLFDYF